MEPKHSIRMAVCVIALASMLTVSATAQYGGGGGMTGGGSMTGGAAGTGMGGGGAPASGPAHIYNFNSTYHLGFDRPEAWGLKYFASMSLLSGLQPPEPSEGYRVGSVRVGFEVGWQPTLDAGQRQIGFNGQVPEDLNKSPIFARPVVRVGLPHKFSVVVAAPAPFQVFGLTPRLFAFGLERPIIDRERWTLSWRGYGQVGWVKGAFTCPKSALAFQPGSVGNPTQCVGESADVSSLRYAGNELQLAYHIPGMRRLVPHVSAGGNLIEGVFQVHAPVQGGLDQTRLWTRGGTFSGTAGVSYLLTTKASFTVDAFYSPLWVQRSPTAPRTNDGLFNVRALLSYTIR